MRVNRLYHDYIGLEPACLFAPIQKGTSQFCQRLLTKILAEELSWIERGRRVGYTGVLSFCAEISAERTVESLIFYTSEIPKYSKTYTAQPDSLKLS